MWRQCLTVGLVALVIAGCGGGGANYTKVSVQSPNCDRRNLSIGDSIEPILTLRNTSDHDWKSTWIWIEGAGNFRNDGIAMNTQQADNTYGSAGQFNLGALANGNEGAIHIHLTANKVGAPRLNFEVWGTSEASGSEPNIPNTGTYNAGSCSYAIH